MKQTLAMSIAFVLGIGIGHLEGPLQGVHSAITPLLVWLMFVVGFGVGSDRSIIQQCRSASLRVLLLPVLVAAGSLAGATVGAAMLPGIPFRTALLVSSGLGYYSVSSAILSAQAGATIGAIALMSNVLREVLTLVGAPLLFRFLGRGSVIASGAATSMDTCIGVIRSNEGPRSVYPAFVTGLVLTITVPVLTELLLRI